MSKPRPTEGAEIYCCIQAAGNLAATEVCCAVCTPTCAGRCARRLFVLLVVLFFCLDFSSFSNGHVIFGKINQTRTSTSSKLCTAYDTYVALPRENPRAREIRCTVQVCCLGRIRLSMRLPRHAVLRGLPLRSVFSDQNVKTSKHNNVPPAFFLAAEPR